MKKFIFFVAVAAICCDCYTQKIYQYKQADATVCFFSLNEKQYLPHLMRRYQLGKTLHGQIWGDLPEQAPFMMLTDWEDDGNAGVGAIPHTFVQIGMAPLNMSYFVGPSVERYDHLFKHEYTHVVMSDKANGRDRWWRNMMGNKVVCNSQYPLSAVWSYLCAPRWYAPRWYHEGVACFFETWLGSGMGRALGGYDEAYFRTNVKEDKELYSVVGLETEGSTSDFQQGTVAYLYGTRFVNYLVYKYGYEKIVRFYNRTEDSKTFFASQFKAVYGKSLHEAWTEWQDYEKQHQQENLSKIAEYPLTEVVPLCETKTGDTLTLGSMSPLCVDDSTEMAYAAVNHEKDFAQIVSINLRNGKVQKLAYVDGPQMYQTAYLTLDKKRQRLIWTDRNYQFRGLVVYDLDKKKKTKHLKYQRMYDICYDNTNDCMYGLLSNEGVCYLVKYDAMLEKRDILYGFPFGVSVSDLDVSHDGTKIVCSILGTKGQHSLIQFNTAELESGQLTYETLYTIEDSNVSQFRFSEDDSRLVGFSYYTGVPNVWSYDFKTQKMSLLSNTQTGLFAPYLTKEGKIYASELTSDGMRPVSFSYKELKDANAVDFLGQKAYKANPELSKLGNVRGQLKDITFGQVYDSVKIYKPLKELKFQGAYPDISGFVDRRAWNNMTPVLGYHIDFYDPLSLASLNVFLGTSAWSNNDWKNKFHVSAELKWWNWRLKAAWNPTNFYDLFGPLRSSRKGYYAQLSYNRTYSLQSPFHWSYGWSVAHYGDLDALPLYQEIAVDDGITSFQTASFYITGSKTRSSLGAIVEEEGYSWDLSAYTYLADGKFFPSINATWAQGTLLPFGRNNSGWLRATVGQSFGDSDSSLGNDYFGGFRNNYVDNGSVNRFKTTNAMPGASIDQIQAHTYAKVLGDVSFCPIRFNNVGGIQCYPNFIQFNVFAADLMTDLWGCDHKYKSNYVSVGAQMNTQLVLFTHMRSTLSIGYARVFSNELNRGEFMISLKLL
ncbi:MAG: hypothetical protein MJY52_02285 [Bacteroidaceae bacterium]|nr:hypothetical protein [Bacteroidaceae bacterium]